MGGAAASFTLDRRTGARASGRGRPWTNAEIAVASFNLVIAIAIVWVFHARFWWAPDDGAYAYIAGRLLDGAVLGRDLHDIHAGYVHFLHALAIDWFGRDIVSLRYPLAALTVVQSVIVFAMLRPLIGAAAIGGGLAMSALTFVQFLNPSANWYALFLTVVLIALLAARVQQSFAGLVAIGCVIGLLFLFRQLTGVLVGIGAFAWLLLPAPGTESPRSSPLLARMAAAAAFLALAAYLALKIDPAALLLYGIGPLGVLAITISRTQLGNQPALRMMGALAMGAILSVLPLLLYHLWHGTVWIWFDDTVLAAISLTGLDFFGRVSYATLLALAAQAVGATGEPVAMLNGLFWLLVLLSPLTLAGALLLHLRSEGTVHPLPFIALFHALVSAHYAIPIYALYSVGLTLAGLLALARTPRARTVALSAVLFAVVVGLAFQAAQPLSRSLHGIIRGERVTLDAGGLPHAQIRMERADQDTYRAILTFIDEHAGPDQTVLGLPMIPELYFLSSRKPPVRFIIAPLDLRSDADVRKALDQVETAMTPVLIFKRNDKYTTPHVRELLNRLLPNYRLCSSVGPFDLYALNACRT